MDKAIKVLFIQPWIYDFSAYDFWIKPLGLLYTASLVREYCGAEVRFLDCLDGGRPGSRPRLKARPDGRGHFPKEEVPKPAVLKDVPRRFSRYGISPAEFEEALAREPVPDVVMMTCAMTYWYPGVQAVVELVRRRFGSVPVLLGGSYATLCPEHAAAHSGADLVVSGPAEVGLWPVMREVLGAGAVVCDAPVPGPFSALPRPAFDLVQNRAWLPILTSRGCPFRCSFCASFRLAPAYEQRPVDSVFSEIEDSCRRFGTRRFVLYDDAFLVDRGSHAQPLLRMIASSGLDLRIETPNGLHLSAVDGETAALFRSAGVGSIHLSLESSSDEFLKEKSPKTRAGDLARALDNLEAAGYRRNDCIVYLIMGLPGQDTAGIGESIEYVRGLGASPRLTSFSPIPGTREWDLLIGRGVLSDTCDPLLHNKTAFACLMSGIPPEETARLKALMTGGPAESSLDKTI